MKHLITFILIVTAFFNGNSQYMDTRIIPYMVEFTKSAKENGVDLSNIDKIGYILFLSPDKLAELNSNVPSWGVTKIYQDGTYNVYLSTELLRYIDPILEAVLYHEMYHVLGNYKKHCDNESKCHWLVYGGGVKFKKIVEEWNDEEKKKFLQYIVWNQKNYIYLYYKL